MWSRGSVNRDRGIRGQALVEFALVTPVMLLVMLLAVDFGRLFFTYVSVSNAAREGAFYAATHASDSGWSQPAFEAGVRQAAAREANAQGQGGEGALTVSGPTCFEPTSGTTLSCDVAADFAGGTGNRVRVTTARGFSFLTPVIGEIFGGQVDLSSTATAPVMNPAVTQILAVATPTPASTPTPEATATAAPTATPTPTPMPTPTPTPTPVPTPTPSPTVPGFVLPTPTPAPTPTPTTPPAPTPTPTPAPTPTPTPSPTPSNCVVPDYWNTHWNDVGGVPAIEIWDSAGFTGVLTNLAGTKKIKSQTIPAGNTVSCSANLSVDDQQ